jgi:hypothetical protein
MMVFKTPYQAQFTRSCQLIDRRVKNTLFSYFDPIIENGGKIMQKAFLPVAMALLLSFCMSNGAIAAINAATATQLAEAMDIDPSDIVSASIGTSDASGVGIATGSLGEFMPREGNSFAILSTGTAAIADDDNDSENAGSALAGLNNGEGQDMVQLTLELTVPTDATCVSFDFVFYSEEFDEYVGSSYNDAFTAELGTSDLSIVNQKVVAPKNFAFDTLGDIVSVNTVYGVTGDTETTYDGATPKIKATTPIDPAASTITLVFTVQDLGDSILDSAVFIDNFEWGINAVCTAGTLIDSDDDGIQDRYEILGLDIDDDGIIDLDLPAMGADPNHKDIFIEIDYMEDAAHSHQPKLAALQKLIAAFANAPVDNPDDVQGIRLHIDAGPHTIMNPATNGTWGTVHSRSDAIAHVNEMGSTASGDYDWTEFDTIKSNNFSAARRAVFRYGLFVHNIGGLPGSNGLERGIPSTDFIVALGSWTDGVGTVCQQAGSFMHILGHTLGLRHGGEDDINYKPNYLSVMNHAFLTRGLRLNGVDGVLDYSRFDLADLDENNLNESIGLNGGASLDNYGTLYFADGTQHYSDNANNAIDWNDNTLDNESAVVFDINNDGSQTVLTSQNDWDNLNYTAGILGQISSSFTLPATTSATTLTTNEDNLLDTFYDLSVDILCETTVIAGQPAACTVTIENIGTLADTYDVSGYSSYDWGNFGSLPTDIALNPGESTSIEVTLTPFAWAQPGDVDKVAITVQSDNNSNKADSGEYNLAVTQDNGSSIDWDLDDGSSSGACFITSVFK